MIQNSIRRNKAGRSILIDETNSALAGEGTTRAAKAEGIKEVVIVEASGDQLVAVKRTDLNEVQKQEMIILDNRSNEGSEWDQGKTALMLMKLREQGNVGLDVFGFTDDDLAQFVANSEFDEADLDHFFHVDDGSRQAKKNEVHIFMTFPLREGQKIVKEMKAIDEKPEDALRKLLAHWKESHKK